MNIKNTRIEILSLVFPSKQKKCLSTQLEKDIPWDLKKKKIFSQNAEYVFYQTFFFYKSIFPLFVNTSSSEKNINIWSLMIFFFFYFLITVRFFLIFNIFYQSYKLFGNAKLLEIPFRNLSQKRKQNHALGNDYVTFTTFSG